MKGRMKRALKTGKEIEPLQSTACYTGADGLPAACSSGQACTES